MHSRSKAPDLLSLRGVVVTLVFKKGKKKSLAVEWAVFQEENVAGVASSWCELCDCHMLRGLASVCAIVSAHHAGPAV